MRKNVSMIGGLLLATVSACATHQDCPCKAPPPATPAAPSASAATTTSAPLSDAAVLIGLDKAMTDGIPRPRPNQFETPESVLQFMFQKIASRDISGSLAAFPVAEYCERVTLKDYIKYVGVFAPGKYPLDDDLHGRLSHALTSYMAQYQTVALEILSDKTGSAITAQTDSDIQAILREFDGTRLKALQVLAIKDTHPESPQKPNPIDEAMGVTDKVLRETTIKLESREVVIIALLGRIADNWRVLFMTKRP